MNTLEEYGKLFSDLGLTEMSVKDGEFELMLKKEKYTANCETILKSEAAIRENEQNVTLKQEEKIAGSILEICSPLVGVFWSGEGSEAAPYVGIGDTVKKGDVICTIEAMKMFNDVVADKEGVIREICVKNGQLVEFKQPLFKIDSIA